ncbi:MAG: tRNA lysidine(34) synthetase TilS [Chloroflexi bacterium]|nr:tRNA lysidine(34) synthetase TilS [Chloroflexota bacterium]
MSRSAEVVRRELRRAMLRVPDVFAPGTKLVVGFSGGQDSSCLLHALVHSRRQLDLIAVHVDHTLRADSADSARRVVELARAIGVTCDVSRLDVAGYRQRLKRASIQQVARAARYQALAESARQHRAAAVLVAHSADDQAETLLLNLVRGTGLLGLAGMRMDDSFDLSRLGPPMSAAFAQTSRVRVVRPLLKVQRATTLAYCSQAGLPLVEDASNRTRAYTRNRVRLDVLPLLEQFNPAIRTVLARTADLAADDLAALDALVAERSSHLVHDQTFDLRLFRGQPRALQRRLLRVEIASLVGGLVDVADAPVEDALDLLQTGVTHQTYHLPYGVELRMESETFSLRRGGRARQRRQVGLEVERARGCDSD